MSDPAVSSAASGRLGPTKQYFRGMRGSPRYVALGCVENKRLQRTATGRVSSIGPTACSVAGIEEQSRTHHMDDGNRELGARQIDV
ncbi:hypothetical protein GCM10022255_039820 [Dactylosporangium darangshiense]|uniref:Uncharacterized protein n=1 Tax=Dactylosporangium darangshiense TaxID=579108 RepID=A0ABP8D9N1_9ACTN